MKFCILLFVSAVFGSHAFSQEVPVSFVKDVKPILQERCSHCYNRKTLKDKVSFESAKLAFVANEAGQFYISPGKPDESLMVIALESPEMHEKAMPMVGPKPTKEDVAIIRRWIAEGADWPKGEEGRITPTFYAEE